MIHITGDTHGEQARIPLIEAQAPVRQYPAAVVRRLQPVREHTPFPPFFSKGRDFFAFCGQSLLPFFAGGAILILRRTDSLRPGALPLCIYPV